MTFHPVTNPENTILFIARRAKEIAAIYELDLTENARESFKWWHGAIRDANPFCSIEIVRGTSIQF